MRKKSSYPYAIRILKQVIESHEQYQKQRHSRLELFEKAGIKPIIEREKRLIRKYDDYIYQLKTALQSL